jgi:hypothetical protein
MFFPLARAAIITAGVLFLFVSTFRPSWAWAFWVKVAVWMLTPACLAWASIRFVLLLHGPSLTRQTYRALYFTQPLLLGFAAALLLLVALSGEGYAGLKRSRASKRAKTIPSSQI